MKSSHFPFTVHARLTRVTHDEVAKASEKLGIDHSQVGRIAIVFWLMENFHTKASLRLFFQTLAKDPKAIEHLSRTYDRIANENGSPQR